MTVTEDLPLRARFVNAMSKAAMTVTVVTTDGTAGRAGITVSAMAPVSADGEHPTLLVCVNRGSRSSAKVIANGVFCVNVLRDDQSTISDTFASQRQFQGEDKFGCAEWTPMPSGVPRLKDPLVAFDCHLVGVTEVGTHDVLLGAVRSLFLAGQGEPLVYVHRGYGAVRRTPGS
jgi:flavin reductase (DIM6/NTAB) family NADH-FMN oxidoreductase RutF